MWRSPRMIRGKVWKSRDTWYYEVKIGKDVYLTDNTGSWETMYWSCLFSVQALRRILIAGHELKQTWPEIMAAERGD